MTFEEFDAFTTHEQDRWIGIYNAVPAERVKP